MYVVNSRCRPRLFEGTKSEERRKRKNVDTRRLGKSLSIKATTQNPLCFSPKGKGQNEMRIFLGKDLGVFQISFLEKNPRSPLPFSLAFEAQFKTSSSCRQLWRRPSRSVWRQREEGSLAPQRERGRVICGSVPLPSFFD